MKNINQGSVYFWKYKTDGWIGSEWHFSCNSTGRAAFLDLLQSLLLTDHPVRIRVQLNKVIKPIYQRPAVYLPVENRSALILNFKPGDASHREWTIFDNENNVEISFGKIIAEQWIDALMSPSQKEEGRVIGLGEDDTVYVWR